MQSVTKSLINMVARKMGITFFFESMLGKKNSDEFLEYKNIPKIFLLLTPEYGNLGDQAIEVATLRFLQEEFRSHKIIRINLSQTYYKLPAIKKVLNNQDLILLQGGGNFGSLYLEVEKARRYIVKKLKYNTIISMPCSIFYSNTSRGRRELKKSQKIYTKSNDFKILCRDGKSYEIAKKYFIQNDVMLFPDMGFYLKNAIEIPRYKRNGILVCMRTDGEQKNARLREKLIRQLMSNFSDVTITDTQVFRKISDSLKEEEIQSILNLFSKYKVVITDRLHGMILSYIADTPCIVFDSMDNKIAGTYAWIKENRNIVWADLDVNIIKCVDELLKSQFSENIKLTKEFKNLKDIIVEQMF